jgi:hypothetical protein
MSRRNANGDISIIEVKVPKMRKQSSNSIMKELDKYIKNNNMTDFEVVNHKFRIPFCEFQFGRNHNSILFLQAHLRHILGSPRYWEFEFRLQGKKTHLNLHDFTMYKLSKGISFKSKEDDFRVFTTQERVDFLLRKLERLRGYYIESTTENMSRWFNANKPNQIKENPYIDEYMRNTRSVSPKSRQYITIVE